MASALRMIGRNLRRRGKVAFSRSGSLAHAALRLDDVFRDDDLLCRACQDDEEEDEDKTESHVPQNMIEESGKCAHRTIVNAQNAGKKNLSKTVVN